MKIKKVNVNNRKSRIEIGVYSGTMYPFPYSKLDPKPGRKNKIKDIYIDKELGNEAVA
jgi:hypothetical protein